MPTDRTLQDYPDSQRFCVRPLMKKYIVFDRKRNAIVKEFSSEQEAIRFVKGLNFQVAWQE